MRAYTLTHLSDAHLLRDLRALVAQERAATAAVLAHIAEVDARRLYLPAGFPSMYEYCLRKLHLSEQAAMKRIRAGRTARRFPAIFDALAEGRLHLSAVVLLARYLTPGNADDLLAASALKTKAEIESLLAGRFPKADVPTRIEAIVPPPSNMESLSPGTVEALTSTESPAPGQVEAPVPRPGVKPLAPERFALQFTIGKDTHDMLQYAQALLGHAIPSGDVGAVFHRALEALIPRLEKQKFAATPMPRPGRRPAGANPRSIPAHVKRAVWRRDQGRCTFIGATGQRCTARRRLEFDHVDPVARGGQATVANVRLLCRSHNAHQAERMFGAGFMSEKREQAQRADAKARADAAEAEARSRAVADEHEQDVIAGLRGLGFRADQARRAAAFSANLDGATPEERMRAALKFLCPKSRSTRSNGDTRPDTT